MGSNSSLNRLVVAGRCPIGMPVLFRNEFAIDRLTEEHVPARARLARIFAWIAPADEDSPVSLVNFERVMQGTRTLAR
jgi:hypothetical protein